ncbi:MAG TPA: DUF3592 domain-containing protein [Verrucomicrobiae bacterium]|jgi:hypothetical protein|nr:DUF3592 domain-containing protein [Verrucomicrobiae bacterium]
MRISLHNQKGIAISLFIIGLALASVGICFLNIGNQAAGITDFVKTWTEAPGTLITAAVEKKGEAALPHVEYRYTASGKEYTGHKVFLSGGPYDRVLETPQGLEIDYTEQNGDSHSVTYAPNTSVPVYYNPRVPAESVLNRAVPGPRKRFTLLGVLGILLGMFFIVRSLAYGPI